jgi:hypothetical protein
MTRSFDEFLVGIRIVEDWFADTWVSDPETAERIHATLARQLDDIRRDPDRYLRSGLHDSKT